MGMESDVWTSKSEGNRKREIHSIQEILDDNCTLEEFLKNGVKEQEFQEKVIIIKNIDYYLEDARIVGLFKNACLKIEEGELDTVFIFISSILKVPKELEKYITVLEEEYLSEEEIRAEILEFIEENSVGGVYEGTIERLKRLLNQQVLALKSADAVLRISLRKRQCIICLRIVLW